MGLSTKEKWGLGLLGAAVVIGLVTAFSDDGPPRRLSWDEDEGDALPPGRELELAVHHAMEREYPEAWVLDNPTLTRRDGSRMRPDVVVVDDEDQVLEVREAKDVAELRTRHVEQASGYDMEIVPEHGTTIDIAPDTHVPERVALLAEIRDIALERRSYHPG